MSKDNRIVGWADKDMSNFQKGWGMAVFKGNSIEGQVEIILRPKADDDQLLEMVKGLEEITEFNEIMKLNKKLEAVREYRDLLKKPDNEEVVIDKQDLIHLLDAILDQEDEDA